jgi:hypothetical protein
MSGPANRTPGVLGLDFVVHLADAVVVFVMRARRQRRNPFLIELAFRQNLEARVEVVQLNLVLVIIDQAGVSQRQRQIAQAEVIPAVAQFQPLEGRFGDRQRFEVLVGAEVDVSKPHAGAAHWFPVSRRINNVGRQRGENAAVAFDLMKRQRRGFFRRRLGGGLVGWLGAVRGPEGGNGHSGQRQRQEQRGRTEDMAFSVWIASVKRIVFHGSFRVAADSGRPVSLWTSCCWLILPPVFWWGVIRVSRAGSLPSSPKPVCGLPPPARC